MIIDAFLYWKTNDRALRLWELYAAWTRSLVSVSTALEPIDLSTKCWRFEPLSRSRLPQAKPKPPSATCSWAALAGSRLHESLIAPHLRRSPVAKVHTSESPWHQPVDTYLDAGKRLRHSFPAETQQPNSQTAQQPSKSSRL